MPAIKALVRPVWAEPSVVVTTVTAWVEGGVAPFVNATFGFHAAIVPSSVAKMKSAGAPAASTKSVVLPLAMIPVGEPVGLFLLFGSAGGIVTVKDLFVSWPLDMAD